MRVSFVKEAAMAKLFCSRWRSASVTSHRIYGGYGFTKDYPAREVLAGFQDRQDLRGTSNMQLATIAKLVMGGK